MVAPGCCLTLSIPRPTARQLRPRASFIQIYVCPTHDTPRHDRRPVERMNQPPQNDGARPYPRLPRLSFACGQCAPAIIRQFDGVDMFSCRYHSLAGVEQDHQPTVDETTHETPRDYWPHLSIERRRHTNPSVCVLANSMQSRKVSGAKFHSQRHSQAGLSWRGSVGFAKVRSAPRAPHGAVESCLLRRMRRAVRRRRAASPAIDGHSCCPRVDWGFGSRRSSKELLACLTAHLIGLSCWAQSATASSAAA